MELRIFENIIFLWISTNIAEQRTELNLLFRLDILSQFVALKRSRNAQIGRQIYHKIQCRIKFSLFSFDSTDYKKKTHHTYLRQMVYVSFELISIKLEYYVLCSYRTITPKGDRLQRITFLDLSFEHILPSDSLALQWNGPTQRLIVILHVSIVVIIMMMFYSTIKLDQK